MLLSLRKINQPSLWLIFFIQPDIFRTSRVFIGARSFIEIISYFFCVAFRLIKRYAFAFIFGIANNIRTKWVNKSDMIVFWAFGDILPVFIFSKVLAILPSININIFSPKFSTAGKNSTYKAKKDKIFHGEIIDKKSKFANLNGNADRFKVFKFANLIYECRRFFTRNLLKMSAIADRKGQGLRPCRKDGLCPSAK